MKILPIFCLLFASNLNGQTDSMVKINNTAPVYKFLNSPKYSSFIQKDSTVKIIGGGYNDAQTKFMYRITTKKDTLYISDLWFDETALSKQIKRTIDSSIQSKRILKRQLDSISTFKLIDSLGCALVKQKLDKFDDSKSAMFYVDDNFILGYNSKLNPSYFIYIIVYSEKIDFQVDKAILLLSNNQKINANCMTKLEPESILDTIKKYTCIITLTKIQLSLIAKSGIAAYRITGLVDNDFNAYQTYLYKKGAECLMKI